MRFVNRNDVPAPDVLVSTDGKGVTETAKAVEYYSKWMAEPDPKPNAKFAFGAYKDASIRIALEKLFLGKCAYCEGFYLSLHPVDIEHWRPKGAVDLDGDKQRNFGYFWLASTWQNLLPSCIDCNRGRKHRDYASAEKDEFVNIGKKNQFPIADESKRAAMPPDSHAHETPLLLDPCNDDPEEHLVFHPEGYVSPKLDTDGKPSPKGIASIRVYALNRTELVQDRRARAMLIERRMQSIRSLAEISQIAAPNSREGYLAEDLLARELKELHDFQKPNEPFSMMARSMILPFIATFRTH